MHTIGRINKRICNWLTENSGKGEGINTDNEVYDKLDRDPEEDQEVKEL